VCAARNRRPQRRPDRGRDAAPLRRDALQVRGIVRPGRGALVGLIVGLALFALPAAGRRRAGRLARGHDRLLARGPPGRGPQATRWARSLTGAAIAAAALAARFPASWAAHRLPDRPARRPRPPPAARAHPDGGDATLAALEPGSWAALARTPVQTGAVRQGRAARLGARRALEAPPPSERSRPPHPPAPPSRPGASAGRDADGVRSAGRREREPCRLASRQFGAAASGCCSGPRARRGPRARAVLSLLLTTPPSTASVTRRRSPPSPRVTPSRRHEPASSTGSTRLRRQRPDETAPRWRAPCQPPDAERTARGATTASARRARASTASSADLTANPAPACPQRRRRAPPGRSHLQQRGLGLGEQASTRTGSARPGPAAVGRGMWREGQALVGRHQADC